MQTVRGTNVPRVVLSIFLIGAPIRADVRSSSTQIVFVSISRISHRRLRHRALGVPSRSDSTFRSRERGS